MRDMVINRLGGVSSSVEGMGAALGEIRQDGRGNFFKLCQWDVADAVTVTRGKIVGANAADNSLSTADQGDSALDLCRGPSMGAPTVAEPFFWVHIQGRSSTVLFEDGTLGYTITTDGSVADNQGLLWTSGDTVDGATYDRSALHFGYALETDDTNDLDDAFIHQPFFGL